MPVRILTLPFQMVSVWIEPDGHGATIADRAAALGRLAACAARQERHDGRGARISAARQAELVRVFTILLDNPKGYLTDRAVQKPSWNVIGLPIRLAYD